MKKNRTNPYYSGPKTDHFDGTRFFLPGFNAAKKARDLLKWRVNSNRRVWPKKIENRDWPAPSSRYDNGRASITYIGHATMLVQVDGLNILTDPFFSRRASPTRLAGPSRVRKPGISLDDLPHIDFVLLSHNHYDHLDLPSLARLHRRFQPRIVTPLGNGAIVRKTGYSHAITEADWGDRVSLNKDCDVTLAPARHWSKRTLYDRNMALWCAFVIHTPSGLIYFAGDTGYGDGDHFRAVTEEFGPTDIAILPIGAYEPRWFMQPQHMNPDDAVRAMLDLDARHAIAMHHGTIQLTDEGIDEPVGDLAKALESRKINNGRFRVLDCGESWKSPANAAAVAERLAV